MPNKDFQRIVLPNVSPKDFLELAPKYENALVNVIKEKQGGVLYSNILNTLQYILKNNIEMGLATNSGISYMDAVCSVYGLDKFILKRYCAESDGGITKSRMIENIMVQTKGPFVMVGDRLADKQAADDNNIPFICCDYGYCDIFGNDKENVTFIKNFKDILTYL